MKQRLANLIRGGNVCVPVPGIHSALSEQLETLSYNFQDFFTANPNTPGVIVRFFGGTDPLEISYGGAVATYLLGQGECVDLYIFRDQIVAGVGHAVILI